MGLEIETKNDNPFHTSRIDKTSSVSKFDASKLSASKLEQLWYIAVRKGLTELCKEIESERAKRD